MQKLDKEQELLTITMEECGELIQSCSKAMRRWELYKNSDSEISLKEECGDVFCMRELLVQNGFVTWQEIANRSEIKRKKLEQWSGLIPHPPKTEASSVELPSEPYKQKMIYAHTNFSSEPMSEQEEKEWQRLEQVLESQKRGKETI